jgi:hypothetical protein
MGFHTKRSPSQAKRTINCVGALALLDALDEFQRSPSSQAAKLGTATHYLIEEALKSDKEPGDYADRIIRVDDEEGYAKFLAPSAKKTGDLYEVDSDMIDGATLMTTYIWSRVAKLEAMKTVKKVTMQTESRTNPLPERDDTSGTADATIDAYPEVLEVADYKNGWNIVEHKDNDQTRAYLLGKALEAHAKGRKYKCYRITIVQPNAPHEEGAIRWADYTFEQLLEFQAEYRVAISKNEEAESHKDAPFAPIRDPEHVNAAWAKKYLNAGPNGEQCMFCDAAPVCPARRKLSTAVAKFDFAEAPTEFKKPTTEEAVAAILAWAPQIEKLIAQAAAWAQRALESGHRVPGTKLVRTKTNRTLVDLPERKLIAAIIKGGYVTNSAALYSKPKLLSGPQIEKLLPKDKRKAFASKFLVKPEGRLTIADERDPRPEVLLRIADDFDFEEGEFEEIEDDDMDFG